MKRPLLLAALALLGACSGSDEGLRGSIPPTITGSGATDADVFSPATDTSPAPDPATEVTDPRDRTDPTTSSTGVSSTATSTSTSTATTAPTSTSTTSTTSTLPVVPVAPGPLDLASDVVALGASVHGRPITAERFGTPGGRRVLVIGVIHGDEDDGVAIVDDLRTRDVPDGIELWLVESMNPDGQVAEVRHNANGVDLNRNFPHDWGPIGERGNSQYAGAGPASEPETRAIVNFIEQLQPALAIWYHQDLFVINPSTGREGAARARYAELTGWPLGRITGGTYTGIAATWARQQLAPSGGVAFIVELGPTLSEAQAASHAAAVLTVATELPTL